MLAPAHRKLKGVQAEGEKGRTSGPKRRRGFFWAMGQDVFISRGEQ